jgi:spermidine synthase
MRGAYPAAFLSGACVLVLEILGARLVAPFYGATVFVWSAVITVTLAALAAGYAAGGWLADRRDPRPCLGWAFASASAWLFLVPLARRAVLLGTAGLGIQAGALASASLLLAFPLACLGMAAPLLIRLRSAELDRVGRAAGSVSAVSTAGSVAGALAAGFWLIPSMGLGWILAGAGLLLAGMAGWCFLESGRLKAGACAAAAGAVLSACTAARAVPAQAGVRLHSRSFYGELLVADATAWGKRILYVDGMPNTVSDLRTLESTSDYIRSFELLPFLRPGAGKALLLGLGGGSLVGRFKRSYGISTDVVEIDERVREIASAWFGFRPSGEVVLEDGRTFLERGSSRYGFIVVDAFNGDRHPFHLFSAECLRAASRRLEADGVLAMNVIGYGLGPSAGLRRSVEATLRSVFPYVRVLSASAGLDPAANPVNLTFFASGQPLEFQTSPLKGRPELADYFRRVRGGFLEGLGSPGAEDAPVTDDFNAVDMLGAKSGLEIRRRLIAQSAGWMAD